MVVIKPKNHTYVGGKPYNETSFDTNVYPHWEGPEHSQTERFQISKHIKNIFEFQNIVIFKPYSNYVQKQINLTNKLYKDFCNI